VATQLTRRIAIIYGSASVLVLVVGAMLGTIPLAPSDVLYSVIWIALGPLVAVFHVFSDWRMIFPYLIGSTLLVPALLLVTRTSRAAQIAGYCTAMVTWLGVGFVFLLLAWGA
jgi:hypothetical protein